MGGRHSWCSKLVIFIRPGTAHRHQLHQQRLGGGIEYRLVYDVLRVAGTAAIMLQRQEPLKVCLPVLCQPLSKSFLTIIVACGSALAQ